jgi:hypothetical protein
MNHAGRALVLLALVACAVPVTAAAPPSPAEHLGFAPGTYRALLNALFRGAEDS